jgi:hypothetical protein
VDGTPSSGAWNFYVQDHLGSARGVYDASRNRVGTFEYDPYGGHYYDGGPAGVTRRFTGHDWHAYAPDDARYFAPYRYYSSPSMARWPARDPPAWSTARMCMPTSAGTR